MSGSNNVQRKTRTKWIKIGGEVFGIMKCSENRWQWWCTRWKYLMSLNCTYKMVKMVDFMLCLFYPNFNNRWVKERYCRDGSQGRPPWGGGIWAKIWKMGIREPWGYMEEEQSRQKELHKQKPGGWSVPGALWELLASWYAWGWEGKGGRQRTRGTGREEDEATCGAEAGAQGENFGFGCKSDGNTCKSGQEKGQELALSIQPSPSLQHCLLIRPVISPLLAEYRSWAAALFCLPSWSLPNLSFFNTDDTSSLQPAFRPPANRASTMSTGGFFYLRSWPVLPLVRAASSHFPVQPCPALQSLLPSHSSPPHTLANLSLPGGPPAASGSLLKAGACILSSTQVPFYLENLPHDPLRVNPAPLSEETSMTIPTAATLAASSSVFPRLFHQPSRGHCHSWLLGLVWFFPNLYLSSPPGTS